MKVLLIIVYLLVGLNYAKSQDTTIQFKKELRLTEYNCKPKPDGFKVFYDIDGLVIDAKEIAASDHYCECFTNIEGIDLDEAYYHKRIKFVRIKHRYKEDDIEYLSSSDGRKYDLHGNYLNEDGTGSRYIYWKFKTKIPMVVNDTVYYSSKKKKQAVRRYKYNSLSVLKMDSNEAKKCYGRKGKYGAIVVKVNN